VAELAHPRRSAQPGLFGRLRRLSATQVALLAEAYALLAFSSATIRVLSFTQIGRLASRPLGRPDTTRDDDLIAMVAWAVRACARRAPFRAVCFQQGLTAQIMLRRRGVDSTLYFGASVDAPTGLSAHVWVKVGKLEVVGCEEAVGYAELARFPTAPGGPAMNIAAVEGRSRFDATRS
jgi:hypothetical protein